MKIVIIAPEHPNTPSHGGIARYLREYIPELARHASVTVISLGNGSPIEGVPQYILPNPSVGSFLLSPFISLKIRKILSEIRPDCVEYSNWLGLGCMDDGPWAKIIRMSTPTTHSSTKHGIFSRIARPLHLLWEKRSIRNCHVCISHSNANLFTCEKAYGRLPRAFIIPLAIPFPSGEPASPDSNDIIFVGRFEYRKGLDVLLKAWDLLLREDPELPPAVLHIVGRDTSGKRKPSYLSECLDGLNINSDRICVHGTLNENELEALRRKTCITVMPSRYESFGMVVLEAFAAGQAVIATNIGGLSELIDHNIDGLLFENEDVAGLASNLARLIKDRKLRADLAQAGRISLKSKFSVHEMARKSLEAYEEALKISGDNTARIISI